MSEEQTRLRIVGDGAPASIARAAEFYQRLAEVAPSAEAAVSHLSALIESDLHALRQCLRGHDSFDTLAFLRLAASPWDFSTVRESESRVETSQAAQDVVALALLGMGLPRTALTGVNSGQPSIEKVLGLAAEIVEAARTRALLRGRQADEPLGSLAGEFLGYEMSVRGRQYGSIATELNSALLGAPTVAAMVKAALGFTLEDVRAVRNAATGSLNERFFGARDRVGELSRATDMSDTGKAAFLQDLNLMLNECRLFGAVSATDAASRAGLDEATARAVLDFFSIARPTEDEADPCARFTEGDRLAPWGCIADGGEYLILNGFLSEDELRRDIERGLVASAVGGDPNTGAAWAKYDRRRAAFSESAAATALSDLLAGTEPRWRGQDYIGPVLVEDTPSLGRFADRTSVQTDRFESDLLFVVDGVALCVEVKAGSVTDRARGGNAKRLARDLEKTLKKANEQADRLTHLISINSGVWASDGQWIDLASVAEVHSIIVMLDDMGPLSLSMATLAEKGIIESDEVPWIVSLHDLVVMSRTVDHAAQFLEYLRRRRGRKLSTMVEGVDELDMFMWFVNGGMYFEPDPHAVREQLPGRRRQVKASAVRRYELQSPVWLGTLTDPLDAWFYSCEGLSAAAAPKPTRREEPWIEQYLAASESSKSAGWLRFGADLVGLSGAEQVDLGKKLRAQCREARRGDIERSLTAHGTTSVGSWLLTLSVVPEGASIEHLPEYIDAKQYQTQSSRSMLLLYETDGRLSGSRYRGEPQARTADRDAAVSVAPLRSLAATFSREPPSARRATMRLRGKRSKKDRRRR